MSVVRLHPDDILAIAEVMADLVAERVVERMAGVASPQIPAAGEGSRPDMAVEASSAAVEGAPVLLTAADVAARFGVSAEWVRDHRDDLGVIRLGDGPRPRLRFDPETVVAAMTRRPGSGKSVTSDTPAVEPNLAVPARSAAGSVLDGLPVRELQPQRKPPIRTAPQRSNARGQAPRDVSSAQLQRTPNGVRLAAPEHAPQNQET